MDRPLFIPLILGTARQGRESEHAARFVFEQTKKRAGVESEFIDVRTLPETSAALLKSEHPARVPTATTASPAATVPTPEHAVIRARLAAMAQPCDD